MWEERRRPIQYLMDLRERRVGDEERITEEKTARLLRPKNYKITAHKG